MMDSISSWSGASSFLSIKPNSCTTKKPSFSVLNKRTKCNNKWMESVKILFRLVFTSWNRWIHTHRTWYFRELFCSQALAANRKEKPRMKLDFSHMPRIVKKLLIQTESHRLSSYVKLKLLFTFNQWYIFTKLMKTNQYDGMPSLYPIINRRIAFRTLQVV